MPNYQYVTEGQANLLATMIAERFEANDDAGREPFREQFRAIRTRADIDKMIADLRALPTLQQQEWTRRNAERRAAAANVPTANGYYRNPETGALYRITHGKDGVVVSQYSETGGPRRLLTDMSQIVKGKWTRLTGFKARQAQRKLQKDWLVDVAEIANEYAYGFCPYHHGPLQDGISVVLGYGPDCAEKEGLPWSQEAADAVLAANRAAQVNA